MCNFVHRFFFIMATTIPVKAVLTINGKEVKNTYYQIGREVTKLRKELKKTTVGTEKFQQTAKKLREAENHFKAVKDEIFATKKEVQQTSGVLSFITNQIGKFGGKITGMFGGLNNALSSVITFITAFASVKSVTDELLKISDAITNVEKTSGLATKQVSELWHEFSEFDTRTKKLDLLKIAEIGGRLGINKKDELREFTREIDKAYIALGDSFEGGLEEVTNKLGKLKNLFKETSDMKYPEAINRIGSSLNVLASKGTSSEQNISEFATRVGQLPGALKPAVDKTLGLGAAFEESGIDAEIASSGFSNFIMSASSNVPAFAKQMRISAKEAKKLLNTHPEEFFIKFSDSLNGLDATQTASIFKNLKINTLEVQKAIGAAGQNANRFRKMMKLSSKAMIDANSLTDEFNKKNSNSAAIWTKFFKTIKDLITDGIIPELFDNFTEWIGKFTGLTSKAGDGVKIFREKLFFLAKTITVVTVATLSYLAAKLLSAKATRDEIKQTILKHTIDKISVVLTKAKTAATLLFTAATRALTGNIKGARIAMKHFNVVTKMNPIGLLISLLAAAATAFYMYYKSIKKASFEQKILAEAEKEAAKQTAVQANNAKQLLKVARDNNKTLEERQKAVDELNRTVPEYNGNLTVESAYTLDATNKLNAYIERLKTSARVQYFATMVKQKAQEIAVAENSTLEENIKWYENLGNALKSMFSKEGLFTSNLDAVINKYNAETGEKNRIERLKNLNAELEALIKNQQEAMQEYGQNKSNIPKEGSTKVIAGKTYVFKNGKWELLTVPTATGSSKSETSEQEKALRLKKNVNRKLLELEQKLQDEKRILQEQGLAKEVENINISYDRKKKKIRQENQDIKDEIHATNNIIKDLLKKKSKAKSSKKRADYDAALKNYHEINQKRVDAIKINNKIITQLEQTKLYKIGKLREKAFKKELNLKAKEIESSKQQRIDEINSISTFEEAKEQLREILSKKELAKVRTITQAKELLRKDANKRALQNQIEFIKIQEKLLQKELQNITDPKMKGTLLKQLDFLSEKLRKVKAALQLSNDEEVTEQNTEYEQVDILGFSAGQWEKTFNNLDTTEGKIKAIGMAMTALANVGSMFAQLQKAQNEKELQNFTSYQEKRKKALKSQLDNGLISQEKYVKSVKKLDKELANKKAELEYKQAKADKIANIFKIVGSTAVAVSKALTAGPILGPILAGIIGALGAVQLGIAKSQPLPQKPSYARGGFTKGLGFTDETGHEVAGSVHANEYVVPEWLLNQPRVANLVDWLEAKRTKKISTYADGGHTTTNNLAENTGNKTPDDNETNLITLTIVLNRLSAVLEKIESNGVEAFLLSDEKNGKEMHRAIKKFQKLQDKNRR